MTEIKVKQRSEAWFELRRNVEITASKFGDALGLGKGKAYDFLMSMVSDDPVYEADPQTWPLQHGIQLEVVIREAYQLLTGYTTRESGFWIPEESDKLRGVVGVSPDDLVVTYNSTPGELQSETIIGLAEYKAPLYRLYSDNSNTIQGIPLQYMAQVQGQMAITNKPWCDFMAVCMKTKQLMLKRVFYSASYWRNASARLLQFVAALRKARLLKRPDSDLTLEDTGKIKSMLSLEHGRVCTDDVRVENLVEEHPRGRYRGPARKWCTFDMLMATPCPLSPSLQTYTEHLLHDIDEDMELASMV